MFCSARDHYIHDCPIVTEYINKHWVICNSEGKIMLPSGYFVPSNIRGANMCDDLPIPTLFPLLFLSSPVLNMTLNCINYALCFMTTTDTWNEALAKIPWYRYNS